MPLLLLLGAVAPSTEVEGDTAGGSGSWGVAMGKPFGTAMAEGVACPLAGPWIVWPLPFGAVVAGVIGAVGVVGSSPTARRLSLDAERTSEPLQPPAREDEERARRTVVPFAMGGVAELLASSSKVELAPS